MKKSVLTVLILFLLDFVTKYFIRLHLDLHEAIVLGPYLNIVHVQNTGAAFGMMSSMNRFFFIVVALVAMLAVGWALIRHPSHWLTLSLILGGALGNLWDRIVRGYVTDFVDVHIGDLHWPAFNVADSALTVSIFLLLITSFRPEPHPSPQPPAG